MIRKATLEDIDALNELLKSLFEQENEFQADAKLQIKALKKIINSKKIGDIFVYERDKKVIAMVNVLYSISTALGKKVAILEDMIVLKKYRQKGYGTKLLSYALKRLEKDGVKRITLLSDYDNDKAHKFYKRQGFKKSTMVVLRK